MFPASGCSDGSAWAAASAAGGKLIAHAYIMGFQWNSNRSSSAFLNASAFGGGFDPNAAFNTESAEASWAFTIGSTGSSTNLVGPLLYIHNSNGALQYIKLAFVYSVFDAFYKPAQTATELTPTIYNTGFGATISNLPYSSSYVFTRVTSFNTANPIQQGDTTKITGATLTYNQNYMRLPDARYAIYGLTGFSFPKNSNSTCTSTLWINSTLNSINTYTVNTPNPNPTAIYFSADIFTSNVGTLCTPTTAGTSPYTFINTVGKKNYFTVPTQSIQQYIQEWPVTVVGIPLTTVTADPNHADNLQYAGVSTYSQMDPNNPTTNSYSAADEAVYLQYYGANNGNNDTILFRAEIPFQGLTVGSPVSIEFGYFDGPHPIGNPGSTAGMIDGAKYNVQLSVNGFILYQNTYTAGLKSAVTAVG